MHADRKNVIISGHQRCKVWAGLGNKTIPCIEVKYNEAQAKELNIRMNRNTGSWDYEALADNFNQDLLINWGFIPTEFGIVEELLDVDEDNGGDGGSAPRQSDDKHSKFELVMVHANKLKLVEVLNSIKQDSKDDSIENALMTLVNLYKKPKK